MSSVIREPWMEMLVQACATSTQAAIAKKIGYSAPVINQVLAGNYKGDMKSVQKAVEGALMNAKVECPIVGDIPQQKCIEHQRAPFRATTASAVQLYQACRNGCPNSLHPKEPS